MVEGKRRLGKNTAESVERLEHGGVFSPCHVKYKGSNREGSSALRAIPYTLQIQGFFFCQLVWPIGLCNVVTVVDVMTHLQECCHRRKKEKEKLA